MEGLAAIPTRSGQRVQREFAANRLERDILARVYDVVAPRRTRQRHLSMPCSAASAKIDGTGQSGSAAWDKGGLS
jgi:tRNA(Ile2) C34 agmatinyltransferase TiaS